MAWTILLGAGLLETVWAIALTYTGGFTRLWPNLIEVSAAVTSFFMLSSALKSPPVGWSLQHRSCHSYAERLVGASLGWSRPFAGERLNQRRVSLKVRLSRETVHGRRPGPRQLF